MGIRANAPETSMVNNNRAGAVLLLSAVLFMCATSGCNPHTIVMVDPFFDIVNEAHYASPIRIGYYQLRYLRNIARYRPPFDEAIAQTVLEYFAQKSSARHVIATAGFATIIPDIATQFPETQFWLLGAVIPTPNYRGVIFDRQNAYIRLAEWVDREIDLQNGEILFLFSATDENRYEATVAFENRLIELDIPATIVRQEGPESEDNLLDMGTQLINSGRFQLAGVFLGENNARLFAEMNDVDIDIVTEYIPSKKIYNASANIIGAITYNFNAAIVNILQQADVDEYDPHIIIDADLRLFMDDAL